MNDQVFILLQGCVAKGKLVESFQSEGFGQTKQPPIPIPAEESNLAVETGIKQTKKLFRENTRKHGVVPNRTLTALQTRKRDQMQRDLTVSGFVFTLVLVGVILAAYTDVPVFWLLIGPGPVVALHTIRTVLRQLVRRQESLAEFRERDR